MVLGIRTHLPLFGVFSADTVSVAMSDIVADALGLMGGGIASGMRYSRWSD